MKSKKEKIIVPIPTGTAGMEPLLSNYAALRLELEAAKIEKEQRIKDIAEEYEARIVELSAHVDAHEAAAFTWCQRNKSEFGDKKKSIEFAAATVGFRLSPPSVDKVYTKDTEKAIAKRLEATGWGLDYITYSDPKIAKDKILADRSKLSPDQLREVGLSIGQEENFYIEPKSSVLSAATKAA